MKHSFAFFVVLLFVLISTAVTGYAQTATPTLDSEQWAFLTLINNFRAQYNIAPLQVSVQLQTASQWMSNDMATNNYYSHTDSLGRRPGTRIMAFGYTVGSWAEDIANTWVTANSLFNQWQIACVPDALGNCTYADQKLMLNSTFKVVGIGRAYSSASTYGWYWTITYGTYVDQTITPTPSTVPPPTIGSFSAVPTTITAGSATTLSWSTTGASSVSIDNGVGDVSNTTFKTLSPTKSTTYTLTATNIAGSATAYVTITVNAPSDTQAPTAPVLVSAVAKSPTEVDLTWTASTDNVGVAGYQISKSGTIATSVSGSAVTYSDTTLSPNTTYTYFVRAYDAAGNYSNASNTVQVTTPPPLTTACPAAATGAFTGCYYNNITLSGDPTVTKTDSQINFDWGSGFSGSPLQSNNFSVRWQGNFTFDQGNYTFTVITSDGMRVYIDGTNILDRWSDQPPSMFTASKSLSQGSHLVVVEFYDHTGWPTAHVSWQKNVTAPTAPTISSFTATPAALTAGQSATLTWTVSGATSILIDSGVGDVSSVTSKSVAPGQTTTYTLIASNSTGSSSAKVTIMVNAAADSQPPTTPTLLSAVAKSATEVDLAWTASSDNMGVAGYQIVKSGAVATTVPGSALSFADMTASASTTYTYYVRAYDAAGNYSAPSNSIQVSTPASTTSNACPAPATEAFTGCYYSNISLSGNPVFTRTDAQLTFDWLTGFPGSAIPVSANSFSVRWQGAFTFTQGLYTFSAMASDGIRMYIDGSIVLDAWRDQAPTQYTVSQTLAQGTHLLVVELYDHTGTPTAHVSWQNVNRR